MYLREHQRERFCSFKHLLLRGHQQEVLGALVRPATIELQDQYGKIRWEETATEDEAEEVKAEEVAVTNLTDQGVQVRRHQR